jgi:hypothetical protein
MEKQQYGTELIIHVSDKLDAPQREALTGELEKRNGIFSATFCPIGNHLVLVEYNNKGINSQDVLGYVRKQDINASLVGPI